MRTEYGYLVCSLGKSLFWKERMDSLGKLGSLWKMVCFFGSSPREPVMPLLYPPRKEKLRKKGDLSTLTVSPPLRCNSLGKWKATILSSWQTWKPSVMNNKNPRCFLSPEKWKAVENQARRPTSNTGQRIHRTMYTKVKIQVHSSEETPARTTSLTLPVTDLDRTSSPILDSANDSVLVCKLTNKEAGSQLVGVN